MTVAGETSACAKSHALKFHKIPLPCFFKLSFISPHASSESCFRHEPCYAMACRSHCNDDSPGNESRAAVTVGKPPRSNAFSLTPIVEATEKVVVKIHNYISRSNHWGGFVSCFQLAIKRTPKCDFCWGLPDVTIENSHPKKIRSPTKKNQTQIPKEHQHAPPCFSSNFLICRSETGKQQQLFFLNNPKRRWCNKIFAYTVCFAFDWNVHTLKLTLSQNSTSNVRWSLQPAGIHRNTPCSTVQGYPPCDGS